ncbi:MAG: response regulator transcription factor [Anaerolineae bacterium]|nr:response regulator transcription factor [Anaerolineae bacterium]
MDTPVVVFADDDRVTRLMVEGALRNNGLELVLACTGLEALVIWRERTVDLVILDVDMPEMNGIEACRAIRLVSNTPVMMLTAAGSEDDIVAGFDAGADDYLVKPFKRAELVARIKAILNRARRLADGSDRLAYGNLVMLVSSQVVKRGDEVVHLSELEFQLLRYFLQRVGMVISKEDLFLNVWGYQLPVGGLNLVEVAIRRLRSKIEADPENPVFIQSVRGQGYRMGSGI